MQIGGERSRYGSELGERALGFLLLLSLVSGCVRQGFREASRTDRDQTRTEAGAGDLIVRDGATAEQQVARDGVRPIDAGDLPRPDLASCAYTPFGTSTIVAELNSIQDEWDPCLSGDGLSLFFVSWRSGGPGEGDLYLATRAQPAGPFSAPVLQTALSSAAGENSPELSRDGLSIFFCSSRTPTLGSADLWMATRPALASNFGAPQHLASLSSSSWDCSPTLSPDGLALYFASSRAGGKGLNDIWVATRPSPTASFGAPALVPELNTTSHDNVSGMTSDGLELYVSSDRPGGKGKLDIWVARRAQPGAPFGAPTNVAELNTANDDLAVTVSPDQRTVYYVRDAMTNGSGSVRSAIWTATRSCQ